MMQSTSQVVTYRMPSLIRKQLWPSGPKLPFPGLLLHPPPPTLRQLQLQLTRIFEPITTTHGPPWRQSLLPAISWYPPALTFFASWPTLRTWPRSSSSSSPFTGRGPQKVRSIPIPRAVFHPIYARASEPSHKDDKVNIKGNL